MAVIPVSYHDANKISSTFDWAFFATLLMGWAVLYGFYRSGGVSLAIESTLVLIMLAYAAYEHLLAQRYAGREDKLGDYVYYLGFLFTLSALIAALLSFQASGSFKETLIRDFGTALFTTLVGMAGRIFFYQIHRDVEIDPALPIRQLGEEARLVGMQLHTAGDNISLSCNRIMGATETALQSAQQSFGQGLCGISNLLKDVETALTTIVTQMGGMANRLSQVEIPKDLLAAKLTPLTRSITNNAKRIDDATSLIVTGIDKLNATLSTTDVNAIKLSETILKLSAVGDELEPLLELIRRICREVDTLGGALGRSSDLLVVAAGKSLDTLRELATRSAADADLVERHRKAMDGELERIRTIVGEVAAACKPLASMIRERAETEAKDANWYRIELEKQLQNIRELQKEKYTAELEHQLKQIRDLHDELHSNAVSLIKFISGNLSNGGAGA